MLHARSNVRQPILPAAAFKAARSSKLTKLALLALVASVATAQVSYNWYSVDYMTPFYGPNWTQNGSLTSTSSGTTSTTAGSLISTVTAPTYPNDYQIQSYINLPSGVNGGNYGIMFRATTNALWNPPSTAQGSFYIAEIQNPTWTGSSCSATLVLTKSVSGVVTTLYSAATWCSTSFALMVTTNGSNILLDQNGQYIAWVNDSSLASGQPGLSVRGVPSNGGQLGLMVLGPGDKTAPNPIDIHNLSTSSYPNRVDMQWKGSSDNVGGAGLTLYRVYRGGALMAAIAAIGWIVNRVSGESNAIERLMTGVTRFAPLGILVLAFVAIPAYIHTTLARPANCRLLLFDYSVLPASEAIF